MTAVGPDATYSNVTREWLIDELQRMKALAHSRGDEIVQLRSLIGDLNAERVTMALKYDKLRTERDKLRDVLTWVDDNCPGECKGPVRRALESKP